MSHWTVAQGMVQSTPVPGQSSRTWAEHLWHKDLPASMCPRTRLPCAYSHGCLVSPAPVSPAGIPRTHQPEVLGTAGRGSTGSILWPLLHSAEGSPGQCWAIWQRVAAGGDRACREGQGGYGKDMLPGATRAERHGRDPLGTGTWRPLAVPERGRGSGCSGSGSWGTAWSPPSWLCSCARSCSEKERSRFSGTSVAGESSSCKAMGTVSPRAPWHPPCLPTSAGSPLPRRGSSPPSRPGWVL